MEYMLLFDTLEPGPNELIALNTWLCEMLQGEVLYAN